MKILVFDNYDSFTYNLVHLVEKITGEKVDVYRNDQIVLPDVAAYDKIILSPGPGIPEEAGLLLPQNLYWAFVWATRPLQRLLVVS
jgi:anthranilate synthase component 2